MTLWDFCELPADQPHRWVLGPLEVFLRRHGDELQLAKRQTDDPEAATEALPMTPLDSPLPDDLEWGRWITRAEPFRLRFQPAMPDRPVVARPADPVQLPAGEEATFFVSIPVWARVEVDRPPVMTLTELPVVVLSNIWFGDPMSGDLCYSLRTTSRRTVQDLQARPQRAICPMHVRNDSSSPLDVQRMCVHVANLSVWIEPSGRLWTSQVDVRFRGESSVSQTTTRPGTPPDAPLAELITPARQPTDGRSLVRRSLLSLRNFAGV